MNETAVSTALMPLKMASACIALDQFQEAFTLAQPGEEAGDGYRSCSVYVEFESAFDTVPLVHVGLAGFDIDNCDTARLGVQVRTIYTTGFDLLVETWRATRVYGVQVNWLAMGS
jgi:hypothetical protein